MNMHRGINSMPSVALRASNLINYLLFILINALSNMGVLGPSNAEVSKKYHTPLTPAGWAFSIWGLIFCLQGTAVIYAALPLGYQFAAKRAAVNTIGYGWQLTWLFECAWLVLFPQQTLAAFIVCAVMLFVGLYCIASTLARVTALTSPPSAPAHPADATSSTALLYTLYCLPTSINTAWLSVASCLGITVLAASQDVGMYYQNLLAACLAAAASTFAVWAVVQYGDLAYGLTVVWALIAVVQAHKGVGIVRYLSIVAIVVLSGCCVLAAVKRWKQRRQQLEQGAGAAAAAAALQESLLAGGGAATGSTAEVH